MKKLRFLLLDANVVIHLFEIGLWDKVVERCEVLLSRIVAEQEAQFYETEDGEKIYFDLQLHVDIGQITVIDVQASDFRSFLELFDPTYLERLDPGEAESLAYLASSENPCLLCSSDAIVFRVLAQLRRAEQGISLEEVLQSIGLGRELPKQFAKAFRRVWTKRGQEEMIRGIGLK